MIAAIGRSKRPSDARLLVIDAAGASATPRGGDSSSSCALATSSSRTMRPRCPQACTAFTTSRVVVRSKCGSPRGSTSPPSRASSSAPATSTRTEDRPPPPHLARGDRLPIGPLRATVEALLGHPRLVALRFDGSAPTVWAGLARHGRPIQYAHVPEPLALWDVWTPIAARPVAFEAPSAGFVLDWSSIEAMRARGVGFATITLAAGISSTGDASSIGACRSTSPTGSWNRPPRPSPTSRRRADGSSRSERRSCARSSTRPAAAGVVRAGDGDRRPAHRTGDPAADRRRHPLRYARTGQQPLRGPARLHGRPDPVRRERRARGTGYRTHEFGDSVLVENADAAHARSGSEPC